MLSAREMAGLCIAAEAAPTFLKRTKSNTLFQWFITDQLSGPDRATGLVCVLACDRTITCE